MVNQEALSEGHFAQKLMLVLWPGFLMAIPATGVFFSIFGPNELLFSGEPIEIPARAAYTIGFLAFWLLGSTASALTLLLQKHD